MAVGENIRRIRKEKGLTQKALGEKCGMYESQIRAYELGKANPKIETINKIAFALDVPINALVDDGVLSLTNSMLELYGNDNNIKEVNTLAAHFEGEEFTDEELEEIKSFIEFVKSKRNN